MDTADDLPYSFRWHYDFRHPVERIWEIVTDTDRLNRAAGVPPVMFSHEPSARGRAKTFGKMKAAGLALAWREHPYEWVRHRYFAVEREYSAGPLKRMIVRFEFSAREVDGRPGCRLEQTIAAEPRSWVFAPLVRFMIGFKTKRDFLRAYGEADRYLDGNAPAPYAAVSNDSMKPDPEQRDYFRKLLLRQGLGVEFADRLLHFVFEAQEPDLVRIRPFELAKRWKTEDLEVLLGFLGATKAGVLSLSWDLICPNCRGSTKNRFEHLSALRSQATCESCNLTFGPEFDRSVELTFKVHPAVREVVATSFCIGGPARTPHCLSQSRVKPGGVRRITLELAEGYYWLRSFETAQHHLICVSSAAGSRKKGPIAITIAEGEFSDQKFESGPGPVDILINNALDVEAVVIVEKAEWLGDVCTAAFVTSLEEFQELFSSEVLKPGVEMSVSRMTFMFTDVQGSTAMYHKYGDASAFALVRDHFEVLGEVVRKHHGGLVKTIGDAIMASFAKPGDAVSAAIEMQRRLGHPKIPGLAEGGVTIRVGIHNGPCLVATMGDRMDYFGAQVNIASRLQGLSNGGEIVISAEMMEDPEVSRVVADPKVKKERILRTIRGIGKEMDLYCITSLE